jgi:glycosyltransferase involved in cell wall biosynthesis
MKILQLCGFYPPSVGGIETYVKYLSENLVLQGHKVTIITRYVIGQKPKKRVEYRNGVKIIWIISKKNSKFNTLLAWIKAFFIAMKEEFDIIHTHTVLPIASVGALLKIVKKKKLVCMVHESQFLFGMQNLFYRFFAKLSLEKADFVYASSDELKEVTESLGLRVHLLKNAVDIKKFKPVKKDIIRKELKLSEKTRIIITTRRLVEKNGVIYLIRAIPLVLKENKNVFFFLIGDGPEREKIEKEIKKLNISRFVKLKGALQNDEVIAYLNSSDLFVLPSLKESTSMSGLEAMACGLPIVGTNIGGIPQIIDDGKNGYLCEPKNPRDLANKIIKVLSNPRKMGLNSRKIVLKEYTWNKRCNEILEIYKKILK